MKAKLIAYTQPVAGTDLDITDVKELIAFCARVSNPTNQMNHDTADKLLKYLMKHKHWSPFEMASATIEVETTRDILRQLLRHRSFSFQEFSQRYADPVESLEFVFREPRLQDEKNRQNSLELDRDKKENEYLLLMWEYKQHAVVRAAKDAYTWAVHNGIAKEQARAVLPEGLMMSRAYVNGTLRSWIHYLEVRTGPETQKEHRELAKAIADCIIKIYEVKEG
jgi:thymidylate synthase (FAD)